jgi:hypothetical protein
MVSTEDEPTAITTSMLTSTSNPTPTSTTRRLNVDEHEHVHHDEPAHGQNTTRHHNCISKALETKNRTDASLQKENVISPDPLEPSLIFLPLQALSVHCAAFGLSDAEIIYPYDTYCLCRSWNWSFPLRLFFAGAIHFVQSVSRFWISIYLLLLGSYFASFSLSAANTTRTIAYTKALPVVRGRLGRCTAAARLYSSRSEQCSSVCMLYLCLCQTICQFPVVKICHFLLSVFSQHRPNPDLPLNSMAPCPLSSRTQSGESTYTTSPTTNTVAAAPPSHPPAPSTRTASTTSLPPTTHPAKAVSPPSNSGPP